MTVLLGLLLAACSNPRLSYYAWCKALIAVFLSAVTWAQGDIGGYLLSLCRLNIHFKTIWSKIIKKNNKTLTSTSFNCKLQMQHNVILWVFVLLASHSSGPLLTGARSSLLLQYRLRLLKALGPLCCFSWFHDSFKLLNLWPIRYWIDYYFI